MQTMQLTSSFCGSQVAFQPRAQRGCAKREARSVLIRAQADPQAQVSRKKGFNIPSKQSSGDRFTIVLVVV